MPENELPQLAPAPLGSATFRNAIRDFFLTNPIARASQLMGELSSLERGRTERALAAE